MANLDDRLMAMIAQIVDAYGKYNSSRGPSYSSYQALKAMGLDQPGGRAAAGTGVDEDHLTPGRPQGRQQRQGKPHGAKHIDFHGGPPLLDGGFAHPARVCHAGIVDQYVEFHDRLDRRGASGA